MRKFRMSIVISLLVAAIGCASFVTPLYADPNGGQGQGTSGPQSQNPAPKQDVPLWVWMLMTIALP